jgi:hypothetical protein
MSFAFYAHALMAASASATQGIPPLLGIRTWNLFGINVSQTLILQLAEGLVNTSRGSSLASLGYRDVGTDDGWQKAKAGVDGGYHDAAGNPIVDTDKFPDLQAMNDAIHGLGLTSSWYNNNCWNADSSSEPGGQLARFAGEVKLVVEAGFDGVKLDSCSGSKNIALYAYLFNATLPPSKKVGTTFVIENCHNGPFYPEPSYRFPPNNPVWCPFNIYRTSTDVESRYDVIFGMNLRRTLPFLASGLSFPGCWAYPDMLEVGVLPGLHAGEYFLPLNEARAHFNAWAIVSSPLVLSLDVRNSTTVALVYPIIANTEAIGVNQAWAGSAGGQLMASGATKTWIKCGSWANCSAPEWEVLYKPLPNGSAALLFLNHGDGPLAENIVVSWDSVPDLACAPAEAEKEEGAMSCAVRDLDLHSDLGQFTGSFTVQAGQLASHTSLFVKAS